MAVLSWVANNGGRATDASSIGIYNQNPAAPYWWHSYMAVYAQPIDIPFAARADVWVAGFKRFPSTAGHYSLDAVGIKFSSGGTDLIRVRVKETTNNTLALEIWDGVAWVELDTFVSPHLNSNLIETSARMDLHVKLDDVSGVVEIKKGGEVILSFSGDTLRTAATTVDKCTITGWATGWAYDHGAFFAADEDVTDIIMVTPFSRTDGALTGWAPTTAANWANIDKRDDAAGTLDGASNATGTLDAIHTLITDNTISPNFATGYSVVGVMALVRARCETGGTGAMQPVVRCGAANAEGTKVVLDETWRPYWHMFTTNPATLAAFTPADLDSLEIGVKAVAVA